MPHIGHGKAMATSAQPPEEIGRAGWLFIGAATMAAGAFFHAIAGAVEIVREMLGDELPAAPEPGTEPARHHRAEPQLDGWIVLGAVVLGTTTLFHAVAALVKVIKEARKARPEGTSG
ncbi:hypothetical protein [Streptomyces sp. NBC_01233]|uniref:hypothetical protein n=1 Tax=Streptomyces sp. NBC_01233 TaxID=2903787 RepID=UPI002E15989A|nr:hypothetical protein OG332_22975 [Streptomyces sp. NBC_01233]